MNNLNLITCVQHIHKILNNLTTFVDQECKSIHNMPLQNIESLKEAYAQILWIENEYNKMENNIKQIKNKYNKITDLIMSELEYTVIQENKNIDRNSLKLPGLDLYHQLHKYDNTWGEEQEYADNVYDIVSMKLAGYPLDNDTKILKKIINNPYHTCIGNILPSSTPVTPQQDDTTSIITPIQTKHIIGEYKYKCGDSTIVLPIIDSLDNIPPCMYYYSDDNGINGVFMKIAPTVIVEIPMVDVIPEDMDFSRDKTLKCRNGAKCNYFSCVFAHNGVPYNKVGYKNRCPSNPGFSNKDTLKSDIRYVSYDDIRMCLLYSTTDLFSIIAWCQHQRYSKDKKILISNLDICGDYNDPFSIMPE